MDGIQGKEETKVRIWMDGVFDSTHYGHWNAIRQASEMGDYTVVGVHSDEECIKNKGIVVLNMDERAMLVDGCRWTDIVVKDAPYVTDVDFIKPYNITYVVHGDDITTDSEGNDAYRQVKSANLYLECKRTTGVSTTDVIARVLALSNQGDGEGVEGVGGGQQAIGDSGVNSNSNLNTDDNDDDDDKPVENELLLSFAKDRKHINPILEEIEIEWSSEGKKSRSIAKYCRIDKDWDKLDKLDNQVGEGKLKIKYVFGAFDMFDVDDLEFLKNLSSSEGDSENVRIVVGIESSKSYRSRNQGLSPILNLKERTLGVMQCKYIHAIISPALNPFPPITSTTSNPTTISLPIPGSNTWEYHREPQLQSQSQSQLEVGLVGERGGPMKPKLKLGARRILAKREEFEARQRRKLDKGMREMEMKRDGGR